MKRVVVTSGRGAGDPGEGTPSTSGLRGRKSSRRRSLGKAHQLQLPKGAAAYSQSSHSEVEELNLPRDLTDPDYSSPEVLEGDPVIRVITISGGRSCASPPAGPSLAVEKEDFGEEEEAAVVPPSSQSSRYGRPKSYLWDHYDTVPGDVTVAVCCYCGAKISRGKDLKHLSASGLRKHLLRTHPTVDLEGGRRVSPSSSPSTASPLSSPVFSFSHFPGRGMPGRSQGNLEGWGKSLGKKRTGLQPLSATKITQLVAEMMALDHQPFRLVEQEGFRRLMSHLAPHYKLPSRTTFSRRVIPALYDGCREALGKVLDEAQGGFVHFTSDMWTSLGGGHCYISLTAHWWEVEESLEKGHRWALLHMEVMDRDHTSDAISQTLGPMIEHWLSGRKNLRHGFIVTDAGRNMVKAVDQTGFVNINCLAHILHNTVKDGLKAPENPSAPGTRQPPHISQLIERCRKIAGYFHRSSKAARQLQERQAVEGLQQHKLIQDISTRWNSTFLMLERMVEQQKAVHSASLSVPAISQYVPAMGEWDMLSQLVEVLRPFKEVTDSLSSSSALLCMAVPLVLRLKRHLESLGSTASTMSVLSGGMTRQVRDVVAKLDQAVARRLDPILQSSWHMLAAICDPRIKDALCPSQRGKWKRELVVLVREEHGERTANDLPVAVLESSPCTSSPEALKARAHRFKERGTKSLMEETLAMLVCPGSSSSSPQTIDSAEAAVTRYLEEPTEEVACDPLQYWSSRRLVWPDLSTVARKLLSCPPTSVQSERIFSIAGDLVSPHRSQLDPVAVEKLVFLKVNLPLLGFPEFDHGGCE